MLVAFLVISGNSDEITSPRLYVTYFLIVSALITVLLLLLFRFLPLGPAKFIAVGIASYAVIALAMDAVLPLGIGELEAGTESASQAPWWGTYLQIAGTVALAALIWRLPLALAGRMGWTLAAVMVASTVIPLFLLSAAVPNKPLLPRRHRKTPHHTTSIT